MGAGKSSLIEHISRAPNLKRLWLHYVKMTQQKRNGCRNKQLDKTYKLRSEPQEIAACSGVDEGTRSNGRSNKQLD